MTENISASRKQVLLDEEVLPLEGAKMLKYSNVLAPHPEMGSLLCPTRRNENS